MIGKLQTDQDKARLLDGLEGAAPGVSRSDFDRKISLLDKRVFLLHNVHEDEPEVFHTRWAMNYLPGPLTRVQLPELNALVDAQTHRVTKRPVEAESSSETESPKLGQTLQPALPGSISVHYLPSNKGLSQALDEVKDLIGVTAQQPKVLYRAALAGQARVGFLDRKYNISQEKLFAVRIEEMQRKGLIRWEDYLVEPIDIRDLARSPLPNATFDTLDNLPVIDSKYVNELEKDFQDWIYRTQTMKLRVNEALEVVAGPDISEKEFEEMCAKAVEKKKAKALEAIKDKYETKLDRIEDKHRDELQNLEEDKAELSHRRMEEAGKGLENIIGIIGGRRRSISTSLTKRRMTSKAKADVEATEQEIKQLEEEMAALEAELAEELEKAGEEWEDVMDKTVEEPISPYKKNIFTEMFGLLWLPYYAFEREGRWVTIPAYENES